jgi:A/G-specific adenine glycosylase
MTIKKSFGDTVVAWQKKHGRHDLPWQSTQDPYAVWLSEIMLQQTQVVTVREYFARFMTRFPTVADLAAAHQDEVLGLWSGLGYYSRARNMHRAAQEVVALHGGVFPRSSETLQTLPGIGRSTAAAVASLCFGEPIAILDGNVKRVLTRYLGFNGDLASSKAEKVLWAIAQTMLPQRDVTNAMPRYTQGVMDLGATVCTPKKPQCAQCPVAHVCVAKAEGQPEAYPVKTRKLKRTSEQLWLLHAVTRDGDVWLMQRPQTGVWAGLYCLPVFESFEALLAALPAKYRTQLQEGAVFKHVLTHKDLHLHPVELTLPSPVKLGAAIGEGQWVANTDWPALGLPAPIRKLITR